MFENRTPSVRQACSSPPACEVLSGETSGRSPPPCGTGPEKPAQDRGWSSNNVYEQLSISGLLFVTQYKDDVISDLTAGFVVATVHS